MSHAPKQCDAVFRCANCPDGQIYKILPLRPLKKYVKVTVSIKVFTFCLGNLGECAKEALCVGGVSRRHLDPCLHSFNWVGDTVAQTRKHATQEHIADTWVEQQLLITSLFINNT